MSRNTAESTNQQVRKVNLTESERHTLLSSERRRRVLDILEEQTTPVQFTDLATEVAKQEPGLDAEDSETVERVKISLHHTHLPKMDGLGVLTYDPDSHHIRV
jgi:hypothetical protein